MDYLPKKKGKIQKQKARPMSSRRNAAEEDEEEKNQNEVDEDENEEEEKVREDEEDDEEEDDKNDEEEQKQPPPRNISKKMMGALKKYRFLRTVKSMEELDEFRFKVRQNSINYDILKLQIFFRITANFSNVDRCKF
jgi:hypothetical protein